MPSSIVKSKQKQIIDAQGNAIIIYDETSADIVDYDGTTSGLSSNNVQDAIDELANRPAGGVTGVKGDSETTYRTGNVNITKANIGLGNVTNDRQVKGKSSGTTSNHIVTWGSDGYTIEDGSYTIQDIIDIAEGRNTGYVTNATQMPSLNVQTSAVTVTSFKDQNGTTIPINRFKIGDFVFLTNNDIPDRWVSVITSSSITLTAMESKIDLSNYIQKSSTSGLVKNDGTIDTTILGNVTNLLSYFTNGVANNADKLDGQDGSYYYHKDTNGIPKSDLASGVQGSLDKADSAYQKPSNGIPSSDLENSGVSAGTYGVVQVNGKGIVTSGGQELEIGKVLTSAEYSTSTDPEKSTIFELKADGKYYQTKPHSSLVIGGIFHEALYIA